MATKETVAQAAIWHALREDDSAKGEQMLEARPIIMLIVRGLKSKLPREELERRYKERLPQFRGVPGLVQKYYSYDETTEEWAGIYLWESEEALSGYLESELCKSISAAYELIKPPQIERFPIVDILRVPECE